MIRKLVGSLRRGSRQRRYLRIRDLTGIESLSGFMLDLGGGPASFFATLFPRPEQIILIDLNPDLARLAKQKQPAVHVIVADGGRLPFADRAFEMMVCNSVIEHVADPALLASEIRRVSQGYFLQTPNGDFPLETHAYVAIPFYNHIPWPGVRRFICRLFKANFEYVSSVRYLSEPKLRSLFPGAAISYEKVLGRIKSFYLYHV